MVQASEPLNEIKIFGGAISVPLPSRLQDVSDFRPVPDHQEIFTDAARDQSLIVEVVVRASGSGMVGVHQAGHHSPPTAHAHCPAQEFQDQPDEDAAGFFFKDLADVGQAVSSRLDSVQGLGSRDVPHLPPSLYVSLAAGQHTVAKSGAASEALAIQVLLADIRIPAHGSDLLISLHTRSSSLGAQESETEAPLQGPELFKSILKGLKILDWGLFGQ
uniref:Ran guanine nucleotide release factor n=1 Tax=Auxenochlorella protothecoides TaxID=3075 RepID=A0A1D1ZV82_AUXPR